MHTCTVTHSDNRVLVLDNFLAPTDWDKVLASMEREECTTEHTAQRYDRAWTWQGCPPYTSPAYWNGGEGPLWTRVALPVFLQIAEQLRSKFFPQPWNQLRLHFQIAQVGTKLRWHLDSHCAGAFTWYAHKVWKGNWGGELLIPNSVNPTLPKHHCWSREYLDVPVAGGTYWAPLPNRCILLQPGVLHGTTRIDPDAGDAVRLAVVGFLLEKEDV